MLFGKSQSLDLKEIPRFSYLQRRTIYSLNFFEDKEMKISNKERLEIILKNSANVFNPNFLQEYRDTFGDKYDLGTIGLICREFGFDLSQTRILQIGCGPKTCHRNGPILDKKLRKLGAEVINLDINNVNSAYLQSNFKLGSWLKIDKLFEKEKFDVIFMESMDPRIKGDIFKHYNLSGFEESENSSSAYIDLIKRTLSVAQFNGIFLVYGCQEQDFRIPESVNDIIGNCEIDWNFIVSDSRYHSLGTQIYRDSNYSLQFKF